MSLLLDQLRHVLDLSTSPVEVLFLYIYHNDSCKIGAPAQINLEQFSNHYNKDECLINVSSTYIDECLAFTTRSWDEAPAVFEFPGFKCVYLTLNNYDKDEEEQENNSDGDDEDEAEEERISCCSFKFMEKLCSVLATYPFQLFELRLEGKKTDDSGIPGRIVDALSLNTSLQHLALAAFDNYVNRRNYVFRPEVYLYDKEEEAMSAFDLNLRYNHWHLSHSDYDILASALARSSPPALQTLKLHDDGISAGQVRGIFTALEKNTTLSSLGLPFCAAVDGKEVYEAIIDLLSINLTLKTLDLKNTPLMDKNPAWKRTIEAMLHSSNEQELGLRATLSKFSTSTVQPTTTRVFFCGEGFAGKSTLQKSMTNLLLDVGKRVKQEMYNLVCCKGKQVLRRTTGIEVSSVNHEGLEILFWDLAGQREYHAYHDFMFPNEQGPSLFLVVCSLIHNISSQHQLAGNLKTEEEILRELRYWLLYISSNTKKISRRTPHVSFVFTHIDMIKSWETSAIDIRVKADTKDLEQEFLSVAKVVGTFFINACNHDSVRPVLQHALQESKEIVKSCQPIYSVCNNAKKVLAKWIKDHPHEPWMKVHGFIRLCSRKLIQCPFRHKEFHDVNLAVLSSLHQTGSLIYFNDLGLVLVNLQWFCKDFMGGILEQTTQLPNLENHKGLWKREEFKGILERLINLKVSKQNKYVPRKGSSSMTADRGPKLDVEKLVEIMIQLELCFEDVSRNSFFIPATLCQSRAQTNRRWTAEIGSDVSYVGRRLKCHDEKLTFLPPGFFPRLQVHLKKLFKELPYEVEKNLIKIVADRKEVLIEFSEAPASFIDIMVRFSKTKALHDVLEFISNKVIEDIRDLKSRTGCWQGVDLIEVALRPSCVKVLVQPEIKTNQCTVSLEKLTSNVQLENDSVCDIESLTHVWDTLEAASLCQECTPIIELLGEKCFTSILVKRIVQVEELSKQVGIHDYGASPSGDCNSIMNPSPPFKRHNSMLLRSRDADMYDMKLQLKRMEQKIDAMAKDVKDVKDAVHKMVEQKEKLMPEIQKLLAELHGDINAKIPQLFLFNEVDRTLISKLVPGMSNLKLHFMCESKPMPHLPPDQEGIKITTLDEGVVKSLMPYMQFLLSTLALGFKLGANIAHGLMVPDLSSLIEGLLSASRGIIDRSKVPRSEAIDPVIKEKARIWLQNFMRGEECDNPNEILSRFKLLKHCRDGRCAWLCEDHYRQASAGN